MEYETNFRKKHICSNCGRSGHEFRNCIEPITSYGIINVCISDEYNESMIIKDKFCTKKNTYYRVSSRKHPEISCFISNHIRVRDHENMYKLDNEMIPYRSNEDIHKFCYYKNRILFMMVSRRFSLGFIEFIRGKYDVSDTKSIINLFQHMYEHEIKFINKNRYKYDNILYHFLNRNNEPKKIVLNRIYEGKYSNEYCEAKIKFNMLLNSSNEENNNIPVYLEFYIKHIKPKWKSPEWGFPKGRRDKRSEENMVCACREFEEETGYKKSDYSVLNKIEPIEEKLTGTNGVNYKHIYYLAINNCDINSDLTDYDTYEIGEIKWFTYDEAMARIRPYHIEKKRILTRVYLFILNYLIHNINNT
ncbi:putative diphosphoinositol polyphosphate phosphohydrolase [Acanthamoeba castellanii mimivirus]|uniref:Putative mRNA-decapping protein n=5 Tax=Mimivirus TaxID=315393 RepID=DIPP_MIMIV|nr:putative diphosphoinositol polyphosphate phosphohydrolase [Acanthamoeba polyphaga mimivirus]Q5UQW2.1 RecName: Full=Putative mRNA-decapping protein; AltName: Full=Diphosphoinositol polyphosphate phosphohydrolase; Short=DIPP [Acanthamoeba polyphaga mimivirus]AEQ60564.1 nudix hydrolase [Acanthamoeba castellanii mamavirus]AHA45488.1 putative diphosphoinositol polyphosphate phosphohydrolase [Hirudovirus strain Sangsue]ALR83955.1 nudix hydrolase [Niemeyer virus]AMK61880.1 diphosphoinositol polyph